MVPVSNIIKGMHYAVSHFGRRKLCHAPPTLFKLWDNAKKTSKSPQLKQTHLNIKKALATRHFNQPWVWAVQTLKIFFTLCKTFAALKSFFNSTRDVEAAICELLLLAPLARLLPLLDDKVFAENFLILKILWQNLFQGTKSKHIAYKNLEQKCYTSLKQKRTLEKKAIPRENGTSGTVVLLQASITSIFKFYF